MIEFRSLRYEELDAWFEHCVHVFSDGIDNPVLKGVFINHFYMDPNRDLEGILVAVENNCILSTVRIFYRKAYFFGKEMKVGGIGEVSTILEHRGKGLANRLLEEAIKQMKERGIHISMLRGTAGIYSRLGWMKTTTYRQVSKAAGRDELVHRLRPVDYDHEIPYLKAIYKEYSERLNGPFVRGDDYYWRFWVKMEGRNLWVIENERDEIIGYLCFQYHDGCILVDEFCVLLAYEDIFDQAVSKLCSMMNKEDADVKFESLIRSRMKVESYESNGSNMYMLINPITLGETVIQSTEELVDMFKNINAPIDGKTVSEVLFWGIDSF
ncbi:putative N-acetyltransferase YhbS [Paenibacillus castaneae]|uniref:GNAT family N-acetyltransferase n=1 Tax=Paenibacillus castaneae TaxID=474957 RepID=UPI00141AC26D|nr:GNAT family N-acetyltransferase [Paenibacillus castaneae]NIK77289.1 putative N-acetyltransferase YhbS [Paenibacillus castaneae]